MKEIIRADILGFCMGVRRAMEMAEQARIDFPTHKILSTIFLQINQNWFVLFSY